MEPDDPIDGADEREANSSVPSSCPELTIDCVVVLSFHVEYTEEYPDTLPNVSLSVEKGELDDDDITQLVGELEKVVWARRVFICSWRRSHFRIA